MKTKAKHPGQRIYPWEKWFARKSFTLVRGKDYFGHTYTMAQQVRNAAGPKKLNLGPVSIQIADDEESIHVRVSSSPHGKENGRDGKESSCLFQ